MDNLRVLAFSRAFIVVGHAVGAADWEVNPWTDAGAFGGRRQTASLGSDFSFVAFCVTDVIIAYAVFPANWRNVSDAINALLDWTAFTSAFKSPLDFCTAEFTFTDIISAVNSANRLIDKRAIAR